MNKQQEQRLQEAKYILLKMKCANCNECEISPCLINEESGLLCPKEIDQLLNLRDSEGPIIAVVDSEQNEPLNDWINEDMRRGWSIAWKVAKKEGWRKVILPE